MRHLFRWSEWVGACGFRRSSTGSDENAAPKPRGTRNAKVEALALAHIVGCDPRPDSPTPKCSYTPCSACKCSGAAGTYVLIDSIDSRPDHFQSQQEAAGRGIELADIRSVDPDNQPPAEASVLSHLNNPRLNCCGERHDDGAHHAPPPPRRIAPPGTPAGAAGMWIRRLGVCGHLVHFRGGTCGRSTE